MSKSVSVVGVKSINKNGKQTVINALPSSVKVFELDLNVERFKMGSLDSMLQGLDRITRLEMQTENFLKRIEKIFSELDPEKNLYGLTIDVTHTGPTTLLKYLQNFVWDDSSYPRGSALQNQIKSMEEKLESLDKILRLRQNSFQETKTRMASAGDRKDTAAALLNGDLNDLIYDLVSKKVIRSPETIFKSTPYFQSLVVFIPKTHMEAFQLNYELDAEYIVPQSLVQLHEAFDFVMVHVLAFRRGVEDIRTAYKKKYNAITRDVELNLEAARNREAEKKKIGEQNVTDRSQLKNSALETFKEVIVMLVHVKVFKAVIDSNLRFGGPSHFSALLLVFDKSREQRIVQELIKAFAEKEKLGFYGTKEQLNDTEDFFPFVYAGFNFGLQ